MTVLLVTVLLIPIRPATAQEAAGPFLDLLTVSSDAYPNVSVVFDARNESGAPFGALNPDNLTVTAGDNTVADVELQQDTSVGLDLVLVLDQSTNAANWGRTQAMVDEILGVLRSQDRVAITAFADDVVLIQDFTSNMDEARAAVGETEPGGEFSASLPAMLDGIERLEDLDSARGVVIVLADAPDNISQQTPEQVQSAAQSAGVTIAVASYGAGQNVDDYDQIADATGGRRASAANIEDLQTPVVQWVNAYLPAWRLTFESPITADNQDYPLSLSYSTAAGETTVTGQFVALVRDVEVALLGLEPDQPVTGVVELTVEATTPGELAQVEYHVDGQAVGATATLEPFGWDTTIVEPGTRQVEVTVTDDAGNAGSTSVQVQVIRPALRLEVNAVESDDFPQVVIYADAFGLNGLPLRELSAQAFQVDKDAETLSGADLTVEPDTSQPLGLVLALDRSVSVADWAQLRAAANSLIDTLRPGDEVAIYAFAQDVTLVQAATANHGAAKAALATVNAFSSPAEIDSPHGDNALYSALLDAANLAGVLSHDRVAVIAVTDGPDDTGAISVGQLSGVLRGQNVPVHLFAFGNQIDAPEMLFGLSQLTGGNASQVNTAADLRSALQSLGALLQSGYRISYRSALTADGASHDFTLRVRAENGEAAATGTLVAHSGAVHVSIPEIEPGATVAGAVNLTAQAQAPARIVEVVYRVNDEVLAEVEDIDFTIMWNSDTVAPGPYNLSVTVTDAAGNVGETEVDFVVIPPIVLSVAYATPALAQEVEVGERVELEIEIEAVNDGVRVEARLGGQVMGTDDRPPYFISFGTGNLEPGKRTIAVVAQDDEGYQAVQELDLNLVATGTENGTAGGAATGDSGDGDGLIAAGLFGGNNGFSVWGSLRALGIIGVGAALLGFLWWLFAMIRRNRRTQRLTPVRMVLTNTGNAATAYLLRGEDESRTLTFEFWLDGRQLGLPPVARLEAEPAAATGQSRYAPAPAPVLAGAAQNGNNTQANGQFEGEYDEESEGEGGGGGLAGLGGRVQEAGMVASILASILTSVAMFLPRNLSQPVRRLGMTMRRGTMMTRRVSRVQRQIGRLNKTEMGSQMVDRTQQGAAQLGEVARSETTRQAVADAGRTAQSTMAGAASSATAAAQRTRNPFSNVTGALGQAGSAATAAVSGQPAAGAGVRTGAGNRSWVYVPQLPPGASATIDAMIGGADRNVATRHYPFRVIARALEDESGAHVVEGGSVRIQGPPWWRRHLWTLLGVAAGLMAVLAALIWLF